MTLFLRPLSVGEMLDRAFSIYRDHFKLFLGIMVWPQLASFAVSTGMVMIPAALTSAGGNADAAAAIAVIAVVIYWPIWLAVQFGSYYIAQAASTYAVSQVYLERSTTIGASYAFIRGRFGAMLVVILLSLIALAVGFFAFFIGMLFAALFFSLAIPVTVLEGRGPVESMKRSFNLVKDDLGRIFVILILFGALNLAMTYTLMIPSFVVLAVLSEHGQPPIWVNSLIYLGSFISGLLIWPLLNIALAVAYYDERVRKEALDMQFMMAAIDRNAMAAAAAAAGAPPSA
jgi:hypothetical protein